jgi:hypothetical protein
VEEDTHYDGGSILLFILFSSKRGYLASNGPLFSLQS